ncbi:MAG TPA: XylR family transcriptional regulator [Planctomycetaceae bacterium]|nr:XylR family transcriptional regulator [Planctomycetaceae bacterium]
MAEEYHIALLIESSRVCGRELLRGIARFAQIKGNWILYHQERSLGDTAPDWLKSWRGDGIIARIDSKHLLDQVRATRLPTVDTRLLFDVEDIPSVGVDNRAVARVAVEHLLERRFRHYAACGFAGVNYSEERCASFAECAAARGYSVDTWLGRVSRRARTTAIIESRGFSHEEELQDWLMSLAKPVGIFATNDVRGQQVLNACRHCGLAVPDEIAVLGVDDDPVICDLCWPPLSSIAFRFEAMGYQAAEVLDQLMQGRRPAVHRQLVPPHDVVARQSTEVVAIPDTDTAAAVRYIREHACEGIDVRDVVGYATCSRSTLERRFARHLGRTPQAEIVRVRLQRVRQLLTNTDYSLEVISRIAGFNHVEYMCSLFKKTMGETAGEFRKSLRPKTSTRLLNPSKHRRAGDGPP